MLTSSSYETATRRSALLRSQADDAELSTLMMHHTAPRYSERPATSDSAMLQRSRLGGSRERLGSASVGYRSASSHWGGGQQQQQVGHTWDKSPLVCLS